MFDNIGGKLKGLAKVLCVLGMIASVIGAIALWVSAGKLSSSRYYAAEASTLTVYGFIVLISGCLSSWISSWVVYGIGEAVEEAHQAREQTAGIQLLEKRLAAMETLLADALKAGAGNFQSIKGTPVEEKTEAAAADTAEPEQQTAFTEEERNTFSAVRRMLRCDSEVEMKKIWFEAGLDQVAAYQELTDLLTKEASIERMYGKSANNIGVMKTKLTGLMDGLEGRPAASAPSQPQASSIRWVCKSCRARNVLSDKCCSACGAQRE